MQDPTSLCRRPHQSIKRPGEGSPPMTSTVPLLSMGGGEGVCAYNSSRNAQRNSLTITITMTMTMTMTIFSLVRTNLTQREQDGCNVKR